MAEAATPLRGLGVPFPTSVSVVAVPFEIFDICLEGLAGLFDRGSGVVFGGLGQVAGVARFHGPDGEPRRSFGLLGQGPVVGHLLAQEFEIMDLTDAYSEKDEAGLYRLLRALLDAEARRPWDLAVLEDHLRNPQVLLGVPEPARDFLTQLRVAHTRPFLPAGPDAAWFQRGVPCAGSRPRPSR